MSLEHKEYCIIGIGKFSLELANNLLNANASVVLIDSNHEKITELSSKYQYVYEIDARDIDSLESLNLKDFSK
ncbi:MAG: NAD-binding protein, partial [Ureaplasma sp.]|nr:NAD-binding protein [Ureaplasma sp.]